MINTKIKTIDEEKEILNHDEKLNTSKIRWVSFISFLAGLSQAFFLYVMSSYFKEASGIDNLGVFYLAAYLVTLVALLNLHKIIKRIGKSDVFYFALFLKMLVITFLLLINPGPLAIFLVIIYIISGNLEWVSLDIILESFSSDRMSGRIRGKFLTILNMGVLLGPFLSASILEKYGYFGIFFILFLSNFLVVAIGVWSLKKVNHRFRGKLTTVDIVKKVILRKNVRRIYYISFVLEFFYALMIMYTPIYLRNLGINWTQIGIIFTLMLTPFIFLQYPIGFIADKKMGEKEMLVAAVLIMGLSTIAVYFISSTGVFIWAIILLMTRIGAALIEILRDSYFYKRIDGYDVDIINTFRTAKSVAYILASGASAFLLFVFPLKSVFILVGAVVLSALWPAIRLVDNKSEREANLLKNS